MNLQNFKGKPSNFLSWLRHYAILYIHYMIIQCEFVKKLLFSDCFQNNNHFY